MSSILYPLGSLSEHLLSWLVLTKAWFFPFWSGLSNNTLGGKDLSGFLFSTPEISSLERISPLGKPRGPRSLVNDDHHCFKNHLKTYQRSIFEKWFIREREMKKEKSSCHKEMEEMAQLHHALAFLCCLSPLKPHAGDNTMHSH